MSYFSISSAWLAESGGVHNLLHPFDLYTLPLEDWVNQLIAFIVDNFRPLFQVIRTPVSWVLEGTQESLVAAPPLIVLIVLGLLAWQLAGWKIGLFSFLALTFLGFLGIWEQVMGSFSLVVTAVLFCILAGIPTGVICARNDRIEAIARPILDAMQSIPTFVYLIPVVMLFGIGEVSGVIATIVYAIPPLIRLTNLGIRQVPKTVVEAALAFGSSPTQVLWQAQIPLAMPTILTGINQTVLFALSMSVITAMIAVPGLGLMVLQGLGRLDVGLSVVGGLGIVTLAIVLDRITQAIGKLNGPASLRQQGLLGVILRLVKRYRLSPAKVHRA